MGLRALVRLYQLAVAPVLGPRCRYLPSCSEYAREALATHGALRGSRLTLGRICRCHPWGGSGLDPVPPPAAGRHVRDHLHAVSPAAPNQLRRGSR